MGNAKLLANAEVRAARMAALNEPHIAPLAAFVRRLQRRRGKATFQGLASTLDNESAEMHLLLCQMTFRRHR
jgi:hypothetical protein